MDVVGWPRSLGLGKYEAAFGENDIGETVLPNLRACGASFVDPKRRNGEHLQGELSSWKQRWR